MARRVLFIHFLWETQNGRVTQRVAAAGLPLWTHKRQKQSARLCPAVQDRIGRFHKLLILGPALAGIQIAVEAWEIARRDFEPDAVTLEENIARRPEIDLVFVNFSGRDRRRLSAGGCAEAGPQNSLG